MCPCLEPRLEACDCRGLEAQRRGSWHHRPPWRMGWCWQSFRPSHLPSWTGGTVYCLTDGEVTRCGMVVQGQEVMRCEERLPECWGSLKTCSLRTNLIGVHLVYHRILLVLPLHHHHYHHYHHYHLRTSSLSDRPFRQGLDRCFSARHPPQLYRSRPPAACRPSILPYTTLLFLASDISLAIIHRGDLPVSRQSRLQVANTVSK